MKRNNLGMFIGLVAAMGLGFAGTARAQSDAAKNCIAQWVTSCIKECATARCVSNCTTQAHAVCEQNITAPQNNFSGPVTATPVQCSAADTFLACASPGAVAVDGLNTNTSCSSISGTVANQAMCGGNVAIYVICPAGAPNGSGNETITSTVIANATSDPITCGFSMIATNACAGPTGCYGLIAVTPPGANSDPGWSTCTGASCPTPRQ